MLYLTEEGTVYAQGNNEQGQLGDGSTNNSSAPVAVAENVEAAPKGASKVPTAVLVTVLVAAVLAVFAWLIVRTLKGKPHQKKQPKPQPEQKEPEEPKFSDRELIRMTKDMAKEQKAAATQEAKAPPAPVMPQKKKPAIDVEALEDAITKEDE